MSALHNPIKDCVLHTKTPTPCNKISHLADKGATSGTVIFHDIPENTYMLEVQAIDPHFREDKYALCFSVQKSGKHKTKECLRTRMKNVVIGNARDRAEVGETQTNANILQSSSDQSVIPVETQTANVPSTSDNGVIPVETRAPSTSDSETKTLKFAAGISLAVVVLFAVILIFMFKRNLVQVKEEKVPTRRVYILAYDDHAAHSNAVEAFATLLNKNCYCDVIYPKWCISDIRKTGLYEWIVTMIDKSDFVVLVNSKAANWTYTAQNKDIYFQTEENDSFTFSTSHLRSKEGKQDFLYTTITAYFNYTDTNDVILFNPGLQYKLPEDFPDLVHHIHGRNKNSLCKSNSLGSTEGKAFVKAVYEAKAYQQKCPDWFSALESKKGLVLNPDKCTQVKFEPENVPSLRATSTLPYTYTLSEKQALSIDGDEAVTLVLEDEAEVLIHDGPASGSNLGMALQSNQFSPEYFYPPESYSESLCTDDIEDKLCAITSKAFKK